MMLNGIAAVWRRFCPLLQRGLLLLCLTGSMPLTAAAQVLEGVGHASIVGGDIEAARQAAREAALRDLALQYDAGVSTTDTVENGVLTHSRVDLMSRVRVRNVRVVSEQRAGDRLRLVLRAEVGAAEACEAGGAARLKKTLVVTGFPLLQPEQATAGGLDDAGEALPQRLQAQLRASGRLQVLGASGLALFPDPANAPTVPGSGNRFRNVIRVARELGAQFVVSGVIRDLGFADPSAWNSSVWGGFTRAIGAVDQNRNFVADLMIFDGFSGALLYQERFETSGEWRVPAGRVSGLASAGFRKTGYGQAVARELEDMADAVTEVLACQPFMTRIVRVDGQSVTLASGATAGLRPGDELALYRSTRYRDALNEAPELTGAGISVTLERVHPDSSSGHIPADGREFNIQREDIAIIW